MYLPYSTYVPYSMYVLTLQYACTYLPHNVSTHISGSGLVSLVYGERSTYHRVGTRKRQLVGEEIAGDGGTAKNVYSLVVLVVEIPDFAGLRVGIAHRAV